MNKKFIIGLVILIGILVSSIAVVSAAEKVTIDVVRDFDNQNIYHTEKDIGNKQLVSGFENNAKLVTTGQGSQKTIKVNDGQYEYNYLSDENGIKLNKTDKIEFNNNRTLTANYKFIPNMYVKYLIIDEHGDAAGKEGNIVYTKSGMQPTSSSQQHTFKNPTKIDTGYKLLYILDLNTNDQYQPGDKAITTYNDVNQTGRNTLLRTFQYIYAKDIVIENIIIENRTIYNDTTINRIFYNDTTINRIFYNDTYENRTIYNDTTINRIFYNDTTINRIFYNDTYENRTIYNDIYENRTIYNDIIVNRTIENIIEINKTIEVPVYVNKTIENIIEKNITIEVPIYVNKTIEVPIYVNKTIEIPIYVNKIIEIPEYVTKIIEIPIYVIKIVEIPEVENKTVIKNETKDIENITKEIKVKEEIKNIPTKEVINEPVKQVVNNQNVTKNNETKIVKALNNNTTKTNTTTNNINDENNTSTPTSNNIKTIKMKETGNPIAWIVLFLFILLLATFTIKDKD